MQENEINNFIGERIAYFRKQNSIQRKEICNLMNISFQQLGKYEKGINRLSASKLLLFLKKYNIEFDTFFNTKSAMKNDNYDLKLLYQFSKLKNDDVKKNIIDFVQTVVKDNNINNLK